MIQIGASLALIANDLEVNGGTVVIDGRNKFRIMQICSRYIDLLNISFINGRARGSDGHDDAGMGGALLISIIAMGGRGRAALPPSTSNDEANVSFNQKRLSQLRMLLQMVA